MSSSPKSAGVLNAFEAFKAGEPLSEGIAKAVRQAESRRGKVDLRPRDFMVYSRAVDAAKVAKVDPAASAVPRP